MNKIQFSFLSILMLILGYQNVNAQCPPGPNCSVTNVCKPININIGFGECPYKICFRQTIICGEQGCEAPVDNCYTLEKGIDKQVCFFKMSTANNCNCSYKTEIILTRLHNSGSGVYSTTIISGQNAIDFLDVISQTPGANANFYGTLDDCDGNPKNYAFSFLGGNLTAIQQ